MLQKLTTIGDGLETWSSHVGTASKPTRQDGHKNVKMASRKVTTAKKSQNGYDNDNKGDIIAF